jgi:hypothetical protein
MGSHPTETLSHPVRAWYLPQKPAHQPTTNLPQLPLIQRAEDLCQRKETRPKEKTRHFPQKTRVKPTHRITQTKQTNSALRKG